LCQKNNLNQFQKGFGVFLVGFFLMKSIYLKILYLYLTPFAEKKRMSFCCKKRRRKIFND